MKQQIFELQFCMSRSSVETVVGAQLNILQGCDLFQRTIRRSVDFLWTPILFFLTRTSTKGFCFTADFVEDLIECDKCCHLRDELRKPRSHQWRSKRKQEDRHGPEGDRECDEAINHLNRRGGKKMEGTKIASRNILQHRLLEEMQLMYCSYMLARILMS